MGVVVRDARRLSPAAQEDLRRRAVAAVKAGMTQAFVSTVFNVAPKTVWRWVNAFDRKGNQGLKSGRRGRRRGEQKALARGQEARLRRAVVGRCPDQLALPGLVWTRGQVHELARRWFGVDLSLVTIGKYLRSWGLSPQKPIRKAYEQDPVKVQQWLEVQYPAIAKLAKRDKAVISNRGELYFTCYTGSFTGPVFLAFLKRLVRQLDRKIHLIVDGHPVHRRVSVRDWLAEHGASIQMHFLPGYSPELNPVELLNGDVKHHVAQENPTNRAELTADISAHLRRRQNQPGVVKALFHKPEVRYAAA